MAMDDDRAYWLAFALVAFLRLDVAPGNLQNL
jgi:hypothetical protein